MLKLIQLNCLNFQYFDEILTFLKEQNADIINLQEATTGELKEFGNGKYLEKIAHELGLKIIYSPFTAKESENKSLDWFGNAILTKLDIVDHGTLWFKNSETRAGIISFEDTVELEKRIKINRNLAYPMVYKEPKNLIWTLLSYQGKVFRNITTHFTATQKCTETLQMIQEAQNVCDFVQNTKDIPTIFSGDLNIHQQASCIAALKSNLNLVNEGSKNTLTPSIHPIFWPEYIARDHNLINGLSVDYVFQKGLNVLKYEIPEVEVSDHLPVVVEFEIE